MAILTLDKVSKRYGEKAALANASIEFAPGRITALIGRSGCGKSTLLKLCNGLARPDEGAICLFGSPIDYANLPALRRRVGYAVQGTGLFPHLSARENICLLAKLERWPGEKAAQRLNELADLVQLDNALLDQYPHQLSGGQQQRVGLCRAMMLGPELLLLDEPFAAIDPITRMDIHEQFLRLHAAEPATVVLVTHDMREALKLADELVVIDRGQVVYSDSIAHLRQTHPQSSPEDLLQALIPEAVA